MVDSKIIISQRLTPFSLFNIEYQPFQVFSLGVIDVDGVVGRLMQLVQDAYFAACHCSSCEHGVAEMILRHYLRAGEREQDAAAFYLLEGLLVEPCIAFQRVVKCAAMLGKLV